MSKTARMSKMLKWVMQLSNEQLQQFLADHQDWHLEEGHLVFQKKFADFKAAIEFVNKVADIAEGQGHHPDIFISYNMVKMALFSHDQGFLSDQDQKLAESISGLNP